jgi:hypothetical protein
MCQTLQRNFYLNLWVAVSKIKNVLLLNMCASLFKLFCFNAMKNSKLICLKKFYIDVNVGQSYYFHFKLKIAIFVCFLRDILLAGTQQSVELKLALDQEQQKSKKLEESMRKLDEEMRRTDELLYQMIPKQVADRLRRGENPIDTCEVYKHLYLYSLSR